MSEFHLLQPGEKKFVWQKNIYNFKILDFIHYINVDSVHEVPYPTAQKSNPKSTEWLQESQQLSVQNHGSDERLDQNSPLG